MENIFELIKCYEFDVLGRNGTLAGRVELFQNIADRNEYRIVSYEKDLFRLRPSFPNTKETGDAVESDEGLLVSQTFPGGLSEDRTFRAETAEEANEILTVKLNGLFRHLKPE